VSTKIIRTGADVVRFGASVRINCRDCGATRTLAAAEFAKDYGTGSIGITAKRLKCSTCGVKRTQLLVLPTAERSPPDTD
jgi:hypothetical protein